MILDKLWNVEEEGRESTIKDCLNGRPRSKDRVALTRNEGSGIQYLKKTFVFQGRLFTDTPAMIQFIVGILSISVSLCPHWRQRIFLTRQGISLVFNGNVFEVVIASHSFQRANSKLLISQPKLP
ncbi:hypothetical protein CHS0354_000157 [Potamilus streckersoni]|uniref:Uncharacterized protein n=1 Tax=Potamilus streckersoni TaxID=2493646 RepID=A0AAE0TIF6_9BIVA|nr:hypothetical protein CHS0354_000157 [Potamilus streckersoni]